MDTDSHTGYCRAPREPRFAGHAALPPGPRCRAGHAAGCYQLRWLALVLRVWLGHAVITVPVDSVDCPPHRHHTTRQLGLRFGSSGSPLRINWRFTFHPARPTRRPGAHACTPADLRTPLQRLGLRIRDYRTYRWRPATRRTGLFARDCDRTATAVLTYHLQLTMRFTRTANACTLRWTTRPTVIPRHYTRHCAGCGWRGVPVGRGRAALLAGKRRGSGLIKRFWRTLWFWVNYRLPTVPRCHACC